MDGLAVEKHFPAIGPGRVVTAEDLDEGALARTVLPAKGVDLALLQVEGDSVQSLHAREFLGDIFKF
jgi:hypothetical protein